MTQTLSILLLGFTAAQPGQRPPADPVLPESIRPIIERAVAAELDPTLGTANALRVIEKAQPRYARSSPEATALRLRRAAVALRGIFLTRPDFPEPSRYYQALSTFSRLDLTDPGFEPWMERTIAVHREAEGHHDALRVHEHDGLDARRIEAALLLRGSELDREHVQGIFKRTFNAAGLSLRFVPAAKAPFVLKLSSEGAASPRPDQPAVRVDLGIEHIEGSEVVWRTDLFRITTAPTPRRALAASIEWLARIGGRDLVFRWLVDGGLKIPGGGSLLGLRNHEHGH